MVASGGDGEGWRGEMNVSPSALLAVGTVAILAASMWALIFSLLLRDIRDELRALCKNLDELMRGE
jgi:hypothetical protein